MLGENWLIFALDPKVEWDAAQKRAETLGPFYSGPKFLCFLVHFDIYFWFWYQTKIMSKKALCSHSASLGNLLSVNREWVMVTIHVNYKKFRFSLDDMEQAIIWTLHTALEGYKKSKIFFWLLSS